MIFLPAREEHVHSHRSQTRAAECLDIVDLAQTVWDFLATCKIVADLYVVTLAILTFTPLTLTLPFALTAYLFVAHTLNAPGYAPIAALLAGGVTALVGLFCVGLVEDTYVISCCCYDHQLTYARSADAMFMCYCIDRDAGVVNQESVFGIVRYNKPYHITSLTRAVSV